ncbi:MAG: lipocalin family protein [Acidiferrobacterales bacterium]
MKTLKLFASLFALLGLTACSSTHPPMKTVEHVDLQRFMGDWYVIAAIPTFIEKHAFNAVESYALDKNGNVATTFTFREGSFDGKKKEYRPTGYVVDQTGNAIWGMQFLWPIKADYRVVYLDAGYTKTVIARNKRDYVWIMAREPYIPDTEYENLKGFLTKLGYDTDKLRKVPQRWPGASEKSGAAS